MGRTKARRDVKNKLAYLREESKMPIRELEKWTNIKNTSISMLENEVEGRAFRQNHIEVLTDLFQVTSDYLLGNSNEGIIIYTHDNNKLLITEDEYIRLKGKMKIETIKFNPLAPFDDGNREYHAKGFVRRELLGNVDEIDKRNIYKKRYDNIGERLTASQLEKVIKFMEDYILTKE